MNKPLSVMTIDELDEVCLRWLSEASTIGEDGRNKWEKLCLIGLMFGHPDQNSKWYRFQTGQIVVCATGDGIVEVEILVGEQSMIVASCNCKPPFYVAGWWEERVFAHYEEAIVRKRESEELAAREIREANRQQLLKSMILPPEPTGDTCDCSVCVARLAEN